MVVEFLSPPTSHFVIGAKNNIATHIHLKEDYVNFFHNTNLTFDKAPNVSLNKESEHEPRNESSRSIFG